MFIQLYTLVLITLALSACETLKTWKPILPIILYKWMLAGRRDANGISASTEIIK